MAVKLNQHDLEFILKQIKIAEANSTAHAGEDAVPLLHVRIDGDGNYGAEGTLAISQPHLPYGLRTVDGSYNNLIPGRELWGASDQIMPRMLQPNWVSEQDEGTVDINGPVAPGGVVDNTDYGIGGNPANPALPGSNGGHTGNVIDSDPRIISNLIVDQTLKNPAAIMAALKYAEYDGDVLAAVNAIQELYQTYLANIAGPVATALAALAPGATAAEKKAAIDGVAEPFKAVLDAALVADYGIEMDGNSIVLPNVAPDEGLSAPFNGWMTFFGQFFDHGLDLIHKGDNGTIFVPLAEDDPLRTHGPDGIAGSGDEVPPHLAFMALTRLKPEAGPGADGVLGTADDTMEAKNKTTPFVDQNQTYTSHPSHQVFLREYTMVDGKPMATGHLLDGVNGGLATWADVKTQAEEKLGIVLSDIDVLGVPLILTDAYGEFIRGPDGFPQVVYNIGPDLIPNTADDLTVSATPGNPIVLADINGGLGPVRTAHQFLDDIAHNANPVGTVNGQPAILQPDINTETDPLGNPIPNNPDLAPAYDNELLDKHFITGDGRGNENIGLTTVHHVFHAEHNRQVDSVKKQILEIASSGLDADIAFLNEWLLVDVETVPADPSTLQWDGERLFQVGRFSTEMQYQHLVFEEFGRKVQPNIDLFVFNTITDVNPGIFAEFAHTVYRFGHSMLTDHLKLLPLNEAGNPVDADGNEIDIADWGIDVGLIEAFLNPVMYDDNGGISAEQAAGAIARGMTYVHGNAIDEFVVESLRNNLLGLPLDLAAINIARGRDAGVPSLNEAREQLYAASNSTWLKPYESWADFAANLKTPASIINFIAAYGEHPLILAADTLEEKRDAAMTLLGFGGSETEEAVAIANGTFEEPPAGTVIVDPLGDYTTSAPDGWTLTGTGGLFTPAPSVVDSAGLTGPSVAWLSANAILSQAAGTLEEGASYRLTIDIADRYDMDAGWPGGEARLVDENGNVLASAPLGAPDADGGWSTVTLQTGTISNAQNGLGLRIEIVHGGGSGDQILVDDVRLDVLRPTAAPADRLDFLNGTGAWANKETGLNNVDLWIGGLAERVMPFGGMLGSTFNAVFELQMENLQEGDRFYYLSRTQGLNLLNELENNAFAKMIMANTDLVQPGPDGIRGTEDDIVTHHIGLDSFAKYDGVLEVDPDAQIAADNAWGANDPFLEALRAKVQRDDPSTAGADANYLRFTGGEHMVMGGTDGDDTIIGGDGDDGIWGGDGDDRIESGHGVDLVSGGAGDDIITDSGDTGDFIKGESGDDVIANSNGLDVLMGGDGKDVFLVGVDATEVFGGEGDDFMLGGLDHDFLLGNEGDDWMEGGDGFDVLNGDNSELFFNSTILGHDVLIAGENENDFDAESGDDIMVQGESVMRNEGMFGFDWAIYKGSAVAADADMRIPIFTTVADDILRDRFDQTEALSGWDHNDILRGDDRGQNEEIEVELQLHENHYLSQAGVNRIDGLRELLGLAEYTNTDPNVDLEKEVAWTAGNLLIGGDGSDLIEGRGGDDFIHGDAWLNVRIRIVGVDGAGNALENNAANEIATVDTLKHVFQATDVDSDGTPIPAAWVGKSLSELLLGRVIKPSQMHIQREIKYDEDPSNDTDTAIFAGNRDWYEITHVGDKTFVARREMEEVDPQVSEGTDTLVGIERILFADGIYTIRETGNHDPSGRLTIEGLPAREGVSLTVNAAAIRDLNNPDGTVDPATITFRWQIERNDGTGDYINIPGVSGNTFTPGDDHVGLRIRVLGTYQDAGGVIEIVTSQPTDVVLGENDAPTGAVLISDMTPTEGRELTATAAFNDPDGITDAFEEGLLTYRWQSSGSTLGPWVDVPAEDGGNARSFVPGPELVGRYLRMVIDYTDDGGTQETVVSAVTQIVGNYIDLNLPVIDADNGDGDGTDAANGGITNGGTTVGDDWVVAGAGNNAISGGDGDDALYGGAGEDELDGGEGDDTLDGGFDDDVVNGGDGNDIIIHGNGHGSDAIDGGDGLDTLRITGSSPGANDQVQITLAGGLITEINSSTTVASVEAAELRLDHGTDTLIYDTDENVSVNLLSGAATGFSFTRGVENVTSGSGNDALTGNSLANVLDGGAGNDDLRGGFDNDTLRGGEGNDQLWGEQGDDLLEGGAGNDRIDGGAGNDTASYANAAGPVTVSLSGQGGNAPFEEQDTLGAGIDRLIDIENLVGSASGDHLTGDGDDNRIDGGAGADTMVGLGGDDTYVVDDAGDVVTEALNGGSDTIVANVENLTLADNVENLVLGDGIAAGNGNGLDNSLTGNAGNNILDGGLGNDTIVLAGSIQDYTFTYVDANTTTVQSTAGGTDTLISVERASIGSVVYNLVRGDNAVNAALNGTATADLVLGFDSNDTMRGGNGDDILVGGLGNDSMGGGAGNDTYVVTQAGDFVTEDPTVVPGSGGIDTIVSTVSRNLGAAGQVAGNVENLTLVGTADINGTGNGLDNVLIGNSGVNTLGGGAGSDTLIGNEGADTLNGGGANDELEGGAGDDTLNGGAGNADVAVFSGPAGNYTFGLTGGALATVTDIVGNEGTDTLSGIERLRFGQGGEDLVIVTNAGLVDENTASIVFGTDGDDDIVGGHEGDVIIGGLGNDTLSGYDVGTADDDVVPPQNDDDVFIWRANAAGTETDGFDIINGGGEGAAGDLFQVVGNDEAETYRIYTEEEAVARGIAIQGEEPEIFVTRQVGDGPEVVIAELIEIEEIVINGNGVSGSGSLGGGDTVEMYGNFDTTTSLRPNTITILGTEGDDTVNLTSLLSEHRIVFKTRGGNDTIIGTLRPQDVIELPDGATIADYAVTIDEETGLTKLVGDGHSLTFVAPHGMPNFSSGHHDEDDEEEEDDDNNVGNPPVDDDQSSEDDDDTDETDEGDDQDDEEDEDDTGIVSPGSITGTPVADALLGTTSSDAIIALAGDDVLRGEGGDDFLSGGEGRDMAFGGGGNDDILGGAGADMLYGDGGSDRIFGDEGDDLIDAGTGNDHVQGGAGNDTILAMAGDGDDTYWGDGMSASCGDGVDTLDMSAITANITADLGTGAGGRGSATSSQSGSDALWGIENIVTGSGNDVITASSAANVIDAGTGNDTFRFLSAADADGDTIMGFQPGDRIDLSGIDADIGSANHQFTLVTGSGFNAAGALRVTHESWQGQDYTLVEGNTNGGNDAEFTVKIKGHHTLTASDFDL
ncbi:peroxidase family protein [Mesorhizobium sp. YM1C-6-2]|uniref:peroxidase family protein n=1 Tax=Mesorhizobium sp. YM1C-6-2 TaxID=1827501 RepID=UPI0016045ED2|nr:peroxidase family protein [Mesorhizobium sp. YM1C-6-2]